MPLLTMNSVATPLDLSSASAIGTTYRVFGSTTINLAHDHQPLPVIRETLGARTRRALEQYLKDYAAAHGRNRPVNSSQEENERKAWDAEEPQIHHRRDEVRYWLKARLHERELVTLRGDIRDRVSILSRSRRKSWSQMNMGKKRRLSGDQCAGDRDPY